ncbi:hypothetical protein Q7P35_005573 [Cladosporium inversicolor]
MFLKHTQLVFLLVSSFSWRICQAEATTTSPTVQFFKLPYYKYQDDKGSQPSRTSVMEGCQSIAMEGGVGSIQPGWGTVCDVFSETDCKGIKWSGLTYPGPNDLSANPLEGGNDKTWATLNSFSFQCRTDPSAAYAMTRTQLEDALAWNVKLRDQLKNCEVK